ncbi:MAG: tRNA pseudouridine(38-40) synthase TruA [Alphaproteobacteria bacterium]|nr:tRNA pseudouridine(38-40) synthase TruA [Alphaproteobacteria bacterium]
MPRYRLTLEYDGTGFVGWQRQAEGVSVQAVIEAAAAKLAGSAPVAAVAAGRTDSGVHAAGQVAHIDLPRAYPPGTVRDALNFHIKPHRIAVLAASEAPEGWHARFSAIERAYRYRILNRRAPPALEMGRVWHVQMPLDAGAMHAAAQLLVGRHDFSAFRAALCQAKSPLRTLALLHVARRGEEIVISTRARSFLHHQVRNMVGTLKRVGEGKWPVARVAEILAGRDRRAAGPTAPAEGLTFLAVRYPGETWAGPGGMPE